MAPICDDSILMVERGRRIVLSGFSDVRPIEIVIERRGTFPPFASLFPVENRRYERLEGPRGGFSRSNRAEALSEIVIGFTSRSNKPEKQKGQTILPV